MQPFLWGCKRKWPCNGVWCIYLNIPIKYYSCDQWLSRTGFTLLNLLLEQIVIEDCVVVLHESIQNNVQYDYVINDLTEFPVDKTVKGESSWVIKIHMQFLKNIFIEMLGVFAAPQKGLMSSCFGIPVTSALGFKARVWIPRLRAHAV